ncbi:3-hydroxyisobutyrate dehydrogenase [Actinopolymorpha cephalotaxi]|uniref:3-hydroxyisobutyrate dehydrogenase n=1 Tax=Actinopolymorpha cephalotaxi TaxID=504797 RepID=A0A1I2ZXY4_9ACTN|nr:3-hydroxyisobutyrate dehydrogenase [Actinopolymorpha cephalotaxi]
MRVGWIGIGLMGLPMCRRVLEAGHQVAVLRRGAEAVASLATSGAEVRDQVGDVAAGADVVVTVLPTPAEVREVYLGEGGILAHAEPGTVCVDMTTSSPALARELAEAGAARDVTVLDAPVSGGPFGAESGQLSVMVGGDEVPVGHIRPILDCVGATVVHHGPAGAGQLAKLVNQVLVAGVTQATCEAFALAGAGGLDLGRVLQSLQAGAAGSPLTAFLWGKLAVGDAAPGFKLGHLLKDLNLALDEARELRLELAGTAHVQASATALAGRHGADGTQLLADAVTPGTFN